MAGHLGVIRSLSNDSFGSSSSVSSTGSTALNPTPPLPAPSSNFQVSDTRRASSSWGLPHQTGSLPASPSSQSLSPAVPTTSSSSPPRTLHFLGMASAGIGQRVYRQGVDPGERHEASSRGEEVTLDGPISWLWSSFREDLDEEQQRGLIKYYRSQRKRVWRQECEAACDSIRHWSKIQQTLMLCHLVTEAYRFQKQQHRRPTRVGAGEPAQGVPIQHRHASHHRQQQTTRRQVPSERFWEPPAVRLDFSSIAVATTLVNDVVLLVARSPEGIDRYAKVRGQLDALGLWF